MQNADILALFIPPAWELRRDELFTMCSHHSHPFSIIFPTVATSEGTTELSQIHFPRPMLSFFHNFHRIRLSFGATASYPRPSSPLR